MSIDISQYYSTSSHVCTVRAKGGRLKFWLNNFPIGTFQTVYSNMKLGVVQKVDLEIVGVNIGSTVERPKFRTSSQ